MKEWLKNLLKLWMAYIFRMFLFPLRIFKVHPKRILFSSLTGGKYMEYSCNPKYIYECLKKQYSDQYQIIWAFNEPDQYRFLLSQDVILVKHFTLKAFYYLMTSKVIITNGSYVPWFMFRKKQIVINTWHGGGAYKKLDIGKNSLKKIIKKRNAMVGRNTSVFVTSSRAFTQYVIQGVFSFQGPVLEVGMPRNDKLVRQDTKEAEKKVRGYFQLDSEVKIILYAPTYRMEGWDDRLDVNIVVDTLQKQTEQKWVCLVRMHRYEQKAIKMDLTRHRIMDASLYPDMQDLLAATNILITDYSSSIWDYSFLYRPCFLYVPDLEEYQRNRGFYVELEKWHFRYACTQENLVKELCHLDKTEWETRMNMHHKELNSCETGHASESVVKYIIEACDEV